MTADMEEKPARPKRVKLHDCLKRTGSLLGEDDSSRNWISESRCNYTELPITLPRQRPVWLSTQMDRGRRMNPHPRHVTLFKARHGQRDVCDVKTCLPEDETPAVTEKSAYALEFPEIPLSVRDTVRVRHSPVAVRGILPSFQVPPYGDVRDELLLPAQVTVQFPSTADTNKYVPRRRRTDETHNQHRGDVPFGREGGYLAPLAYSRHSYKNFLSKEGKELPNKRHVSAPADSLPVSGFDGGAPRSSSQTFHQKWLPYLKVPRII